MASPRGSCGKFSCSTRGRITRPSGADQNNRNCRSRKRASWPTDSAVELLALDDALEDLTKIYPRKSKVVELKFFGGMEAKQISEVLQVSEKTVLRDWNFARLWLSRELRKDAA